MTLHHIGYVDVSKTLVLLSTNGVTCGCQVDWLSTCSAMWPMLGFMTWIPCIGTLSIVVVGMTG